MTGGVTSASTREGSVRRGGGHPFRRRRHTLTDALELVNGLRLEHQVDQLRSGAVPDDYIDPATLSRLTRTYLKDAFRAVASIQKQVAAELNVGVQ